jgi:hypothetical protein
METERALTAATTTGSAVIEVRDITTQAPPAGAFIDVTGHSSHPSGDATRRRDIAFTPNVGRDLVPPSGAKVTSP